MHATKPVPIAGSSIQGFYAHFRRTAICRCAIGESAPSEADRTAFSPAWCSDVATVTGTLLESTFAIEVIQNIQTRHVRPAPSAGLSETGHTMPSRHGTVLGPEQRHTRLVSLRACTEGADSDPRSVPGPVPPKIISTPKCPGPRCTGDRGLHMAPVPVPSLLGPRSHPRRTWLLLRALYIQYR